MAGSGYPVKPDIGCGFGKGDRLAKFRVNFFPKEYFWGEHLYQPGNTPVGNSMGDGVPCGVMQGRHSREMSEWGLTIAREMRAIA
jgi:hypothetical protein